MAKANLTLPDGTKVLIEGNSDEVANVLGKFSQLFEKRAKRKRSKAKRKSSVSSARGTKKVRRGPVGYITELADEGFFKTKRKNPEIQKKLEEGGHIYAQTSLSPALLKLIRKRVLRRLKEKKRWVYVLK